MKKEFDLGARNRSTKPAVLLTSLFAAAGLAASALCGCAEKSASNVVVVEPGQAGLQKHLFVHDRALERHLKIVTVETPRVENGLLRAVVTLQSDQKTTQNFEYRFEWFDRDNVPLNSGIMNWTPGVLYGMESQTFVGLAPSEQAVAFKLHVRAPNPVE